MLRCSGGSDPQSVSNTVAAWFQATTSHVAVLIRHRSHWFGAGRF
jgi:hypothetical protein